MGDLWSKLYGADGLLCSDPSPAVVRTLRQVLDLAYKLEFEISPAAEANKLQEFLLVDQELPDPDDGPKGLSRNTCLVVEAARVLISRLFENGWLSPTGAAFDPSDITPRHGPGAVADKVKIHEKFKWKTLYERLDNEYPYEYYMFFNLSHFIESYRAFDDLPVQRAGFARPQAVPKDARGPRLISCEPLEYQWIQQGLGRALTYFVEHHPLTKGYVNFTDQTINGDLALYASLTQELDTLDMKDASDRVSLWLVRQLFPKLLLAKLEAARMIGVEIDGERFVTRKFAPMGSALCFPVESLVFWALAVATLNLDHPGMFRVPFRPPDRVWVFGDDLVVPRGALGLLKPVFEELSLLFNESKCCTGKYFRESCGVDAFRGVVVTPIQLKHAGESPNQLVAVCEYASAFSRAGLPTTAELLYSWVERSLGRLPSSCEQGKPLHRYVESGGEAQQEIFAVFKGRINPHLNCVEYQCWVPEPETYETGTFDWEEFQRCFPDPERGRRDSIYRRHTPLWTTTATAPSHPHSEAGPKWAPPATPPVPGEYTHHRRLKLSRRWVSTYDCLPWEGIQPSHGGDMQFG